MNHAAPSSSSNNTPAPGDARYMRMALTLARKAQGFAEPNPMVGAVIVRDNKVLGKGYHQRFGQAHAEVNAIAHARRLGHDVAGADMYVTLEPCAHWGKTPPCADAVLEAKIGRVFCAMVDPFAQVAGKGIEKLRSQGVKVHVGLLEEEARELNGPWFKRLETGLPWVTLKWAQSIDGKIAAASGDSQWISGPEARKLVHQMRGRVDGVMVGIGTALADDPQLTARDVKPRRTAWRIVVDPKLRLPESSKLLSVTTAKGEGGGEGGGEGEGQGKGQDKSKTAAQVQQVILAISEETMNDQQDKIQRLKAIGVEVVALKPIGTDKKVSGTFVSQEADKKGSGVFDSQASKQRSLTPLTEPKERCQVPLTGFDSVLAGELDLRPLFEYLASEHDATNILVEGGGRLHGSLLQQGLVDQLMVFVSPKIIGDDQARSGVAGLSCQQMTQAIPLKLHKSKQVGQDMLLDYRVG